MPVFINHKYYCISLQEAQKLGQEDIRNLLKQQKLVLLVDLDQTLIHTTNDNIPANLKVMFKYASCVNTVK